MGSVASGLSRTRRRSLCPASGTPATSSPCDPAMVGPHEAVELRDRRILERNRGQRRGAGEIDDIRHGDRSVGRGEPNARSPNGCREKRRFLPGWYTEPVFAGDRDLSEE